MSQTEFTFTGIPFRKTERFSGIILDYLDQKPQVLPFARHSMNEEAISGLLERKSHENIDRDLLVRVLKEQYSQLAPHKLVSENIESLASIKTFCAVTAHQLNILTGPLYVIYKTQAVIDLCRRLSESDPAHQFVPVFWLGSEDHDLEEINHTYVYGKRLQWDTTQKGPVGRMSTEGMQTVLSELEEVAGNATGAEEWLSILKEAYGNSTMAEATRILLHRLFADQGLVVIDADDRELKAAFAPVMKDDVRSQVARACVEEVNADLGKIYSDQAFVRDINLFYMQKGMRKRLEFSDGQVNVVDTDLSWSLESCLDLIDQEPEAFSPNVILRPLYQQAILPSIAYVGGGGELAYWMQLGRLFDYFKVDFPMLLLRSSLMVIDATTSRKMEKVSLQPEDLFRREDELIRKYLETHSEERLHLSHEKKDIESVFHKMAANVKAIDPTLEKTVMAEMTNTLNNLEKLESKLLRAAKQQSETAVNQIKSVQGRLFPDGELQERHDNISVFVLRYGLGFLDALRDNLDPFDMEFKVARETH